MSHPPKLKLWLYNRLGRGLVLWSNYNLEKKKQQVLHTQK